MAAAQPNTPQGFANAKRNFINYFVLQTDLAAQKNYIDQVKKPYNMTVRECADRLREMNYYMSMFQGATLYANGFIWNNEDLKYTLFGMMLPGYSSTTMVWSGNKASPTPEPPNISLRWRACAAI